MDKIDIGIMLYSFYNENEKVKPIINKLSDWFKTISFKDIEDLNIKYNLFYKTLSLEEQRILKKPSYPRVVMLRSCESSYIHISPNGKILNTSEINKVTKSDKLIIEKIENKYIGKNIEDVYIELKTLYPESKIDEVVLNYNKELVFKNKIIIFSILNMVYKEYDIGKNKLMEISECFNVENDVKEYLKKKDVIKNYKKDS